MSSPVPAPAGEMLISVTFAASLDDPAYRELPDEQLEADTKLLLRGLTHQIMAQYPPASLKGDVTVSVTLIRS